MIRPRAIVNGLPAGNEQGILTAILTLLRFRGIPHSHVRNSGRIIHGRNGIFFGATPMGQRGVADILACYKGRALAIEVKSAVGKVRPEQVEWLREWQKSGGLALVARSVGAVEAFLDTMPVAGAYSPFQA